MATGSIKGITIEIGGNTTKLGKALEDVNKKSRDLQRELKNVNTLLKYDPDNVELLNQKQQILNETITNTKEKLETLKKAQQQVQEQFERGEITVEQYRSFQREIIATENKLNSLTTQVQESERSMDKLDDSLDDIKSSSNSAGDGFTVLKGTLADLASSAIQSVLSKISDLASSLFDLAEATEEFRINMAKLEGSSEQYGYSQEYTNEKIKEMYGYFKDDQVAVNAISNLQGLQLSEEDLSSALDAGIAVWTAYGDSIPIEGLTESINESAQVAKVTGSLADALNWAGISEDDFNAKLEKCSNTKERAQLITDTLNKAYGEAKDTYDENTESLRENNEANYDLITAQADLGKAMEPLNTAFTNLKITMLEALAPAIKSLVDGVMGIINTFQNLPQGVQTTILVIAGIVGAILGLVAIVGVISSVWGVLTGIFSAGIAIFAGVGGAIAAISTPILIAIAVIASLIAIGITLYKNWDVIKAKAANIWGAIYNTIHTKIDNAKNTVKKAIDAIKGFFNFKFKWPNLPVPHFSINPSGWKIGDLLKGSIPTLGVKWYAKGGVFDQPTVLSGLGEQGPEAVLPLDNFYEHLDRKLNQVNNQIDYDKLTESVINGLKEVGIYMSEKQVGKLVAKEVENVNSATKNRLNRLAGV